MVEINRDIGVSGIAKNTLEWTIGGGLDGSVDLRADGALLLFVRCSFLVDDPNNDRDSESTSTTPYSDPVDSYRLGDRIFCCRAGRTIAIRWQPHAVVGWSKWIGLVGVVLFGAVAVEHVSSLVGGGTL